MKALKIEDPTLVALRDARELLLDSGRFLNRKVRCVAQENELDDNRVMALYTLACGRKFQWTPADWKVVTDRLDTCSITVGEWLNGLVLES